MTSERTRYTGWLIHTLIWAVVIFMPLFVTSPDRPLMDGPEYLRYLIVPLSFMVVFYVNFFWLIDRLLSRHRAGLFIAVNVVLIAAAMLSVHLCFQYFFHPDFHRPPPPPRMFMDQFLFLSRNVALYVLVAGASVALRMTGRWYRAEAERKDLEHRRSEAELQNLRQQLNPHFLFNTLNNIYSLIQIDPPRAQSAVHDLSHLLRYVLYGGSREEVPLQDEVDFIREYIALMRIRLPRHVEVSVELPDGVPGLRIAPLLFIPLVENAFKHGVSNDKPSFVRIWMAVDEDRLDCETVNSCFPKAQDSDRSGSGVGLVNLSRQLALIYPGKYEFRCGQEGEEYRAFLSIDLRK